MGRFGLFYLNSKLLVLLENRFCQRTFLDSKSIPNERKMKI